MKITYLQLLQNLQQMNHSDLIKPVQLRDYDNQQTFNAIDFLPADGNFQIGFNCAELEGE